MSQQPAIAPAPERQPLDGRGAAAVLACAADQRAKVDVSASVLEDIAANGYPSPETLRLWETAREGHLDRLADEQSRVA
ncbi:hypothetical protein [Streptomyces sp. NPDC058304]|uniref:hypothetical protein n=1 Tax=Streptomyces sp. NPDC058304 TaxID=3346437 RepID=UPI0036EEE540